MKKLHTLTLTLILILVFLKSANCSNKELNDTSNLFNDNNLINNNLKTIENNLSFENDSFLTLAKNTLNLSEKNNYQDGISLSYQRIADIYKIRNFNDSAIYYYNLGLKSTNDYDLMAYFYWNLTDLYRITGNYSSSLEYGLKLKDLVEREKTLKYGYKTYNLLALSYQTLLEYDIAKEYFDKSAKLAIADSNESYTGVIYSNIGKLLYDQGKYDESLEYFEKGIGIEEKYKLYASAGNSYTILAKIYMKLDKKDSVLVNLKRAFSYNKKSNNKVGIAHTLMSVSNYYFMIKDNKNAISHLERAINYATQLNLKSILSEAYQLKAKLNAEENNYKQAYADLEKFFEVYTELYDVEKINKAKAIEQQLVEQERKNELVALELKKQKTINLLLLIIVSLGLIVVGIVSYYLYRFKEFNKELIVSKEKAEESDKLKSKFLQTISHEIRTPLNGIIGFSEMLINEKLNQAELTQLNEMIIKNSNDLISTIENLVDIAHLTTNQYDIKKSKFKLVPLLQNIISQAENNVVFKNKKNLEIHFIKNGDIELVSDKAVVSKIILHLVKNAIMYTEKGSITLGYIIEESNIVLYVKDTGIGIPQEKIDVIFAPFRQADEDINIKMGGTGLGLTIVNDLVQILGGKIWVGSELKKGSTFSVLLPKN